MAGTAASAENEAENGWELQPRRLFSNELDGSPLSTSSNTHSVEANEIRRTTCNCKSTCQRRNCPCKEASMFCNEQSKYGSKRKPCKNKPPAEDDLLTVNRVVSRESRLHSLQEFVSTLSTSQCHKLILEAYNRAGGIESARAIIDVPDCEPNNEPPNNGTPSWCVCGKCRPMPSPDEKKCCRQRPCITEQPSFENIVLDREALSVAIVSRTDVLVDRSDFSSEGYRFAAYRQFILWQNGYLGRGNCRVVPSCATWAIRDKYPSSDGVYTGFREY